MQRHSRGSVPRSGVYELVFSGTDHRYIGSSVHLRRRWNGHKKLLRRGEHYNGLIQAAFDEFGEDRLAFNILEVVGPVEAQLRERENDWMRRLEPDLNIAPTAFDCTGCVRPDSARARNTEWNRTRWAQATSEERKRFSEKLSKSKAGKPSPQRGFRRSDEARARMSAAAKARPSNSLGAIRSPETRAKLSLAHRGKTLSPEHKAAIAHSMRGKKRGPYMKKAKI